MYPSKVEVEVADREQLARWHRFLRSPLNVEEVEILNLIEKGFKNMGGFTPEISKKIGWG